MLNGVPGSMATGCGRLPGGISQASNSAGSSSEVSGRSMPSADTLASANKRRAPASLSIRWNASGSTPGANGATATPARSAPRKTAA